MNDHEAQRIAASMHQLRPDWPASSLLTLIRKSLMDRPRRDVTVALAWVACEANSHTPARVLETGPWWRAAGIEGGTTKREQVDPDHRCTVCSQHEENALHPSDHPYSAPHGKADPESVAAHVAALKAELAPTSGPTQRRTLDDLAEANPRLHANLERLRENVPGVRAPAMRMDETEEA